MKRSTLFMLNILMNYTSPHLLSYLPYSAGQWCMDKVVNFCVSSCFTPLSTILSHVGIKCLAQGHNTVPLLRLKPATPQSQIKHLNTKLLNQWDNCEWIHCFGGEMCKDMGEKCKKYGRKCKDMGEMYQKIWEKCVKIWDKCVKIKNHSHKCVLTNYFDNCEYENCWLTLMRMQKLFNATI